MGKTSSAMAAASRIDAILERDASNPDTMETSQPTHADVTTPIERVSVRALVASGTPRLRGEDAEHIRNLAETPNPLPPIVVCRRNMQVIDGHHRLRAAISQGHDYIEAQFFDCSEEDAFVLAVRLNTDHGLPLSRTDRLAAAERITKTHPEWSNRLIAEVSGISDKTVAKIRRSTLELPQLNTRTGCDGRTRPLSAVEGRERAAALLTARTGASLRDIAKESGISVGTALDVKRRMRRGASPLPDRQQPGDTSTRPTTIGAEEERRPSPPASFARPDAVGALKQDPSLRMTDSGRLFLRLVLSHPPDSTSWDRLADGLPLHSLDWVLELARSHASAWQHFAETVQYRQHRADMNPT
ncbi:ParB N-terminal domain-containing protein [Streptomyces sp. NBC_00012]|uniref:ParB/RepB/Spo0J family partition protein n=1 Tax=unclassified Streptomyces TaxID=2593676 RepID=UPI0032457CAA